jgi:hypothetical protein
MPMPESMSVIDIFDQESYDRSSRRIVKRNTSLDRYQVFIESEKEKF